MPYDQIMVHYSLIHSGGLLDRMLLALFLFFFFLFVCFFVFVFVFLGPHLLHVEVPRSQI